MITERAQKFLHYFSVTFHVHSYYMIKIWTACMQEKREIIGVYITISHLVVYLH